jgi:hypothetical protein
VALAGVVVAAGSGGVGNMEAGVGTGGFVSEGAADPVADAEGVPELGVALAGALERTDSTTDTGLGARGIQSPTDSAAGLLATGAVPRVPAPPGALTAGGASPGLPRAHPALTANGSPSATRPRKTVLGVSRT